MKVGVIDRFISIYSTFTATNQAIVDGLRSLILDLYRSIPGFELYY